jgi:hypothetical protein
MPESVFEIPRIERVLMHNTRQGPFPTRQDERSIALPLLSFQTL